MSTAVITNPTTDERAAAFFQRRTAEYQAIASRIDLANAANASVAAKAANSPKTSAAAVVGALPTYAQRLDAERAAAVARAKKRAEEKKKGSDSDAEEPKKKEKKPISDEERERRRVRDRESAAKRRQEKRAAKAAERAKKVASGEIKELTEEQKAARRERDRKRKEAAAKGETAPPKSPKEKKEKAPRKPLTEEQKTARRERDRKRREAEKAAPKKKKDPATGSDSGSDSNPSGSDSDSEQDEDEVAQEMVDALFEQMPAAKRPAPTTPLGDGFSAKTQLAWEKAVPAFLKVCREYSESCRDSDNHGDEACAVRRLTRKRRDDLAKSPSERLRLALKRSAETGACAMCLLPLDMVSLASGAAPHTANAVVPVHSACLLMARPEEEEETVGGALLSLARLVFRKNRCASCKGPYPSLECAGGAKHHGRVVPVMHAQCAPYWSASDCGWEGHCGASACEARFLRRVEDHGVPLGSKSACDWSLVRVNPKYKALVPESAKKAKPAAEAKAKPAEAKAKPAEAKAIVPMEDVKHSAPTPAPATEPVLSDRAAALFDGSSSDEEEEEEKVVAAPKTTSPLGKRKSPEPSASQTYTLPEPPPKESMMSWEISPAGSRSVVPNPRVDAPMSPLVLALTQTQTQPPTTSLASGTTQRLLDSMADPPVMATEDFSHVPDLSSRVDADMSEVPATQETQEQAPTQASVGHSQAEPTINFVDVVDHTPIVIAETQEEESSEPPAKRRKTTSSSKKLGLTTKRRSKRRTAAASKGDEDE